MGIEVLTENEKKGELIRYEIVIGENGLAVLKTGCLLSQSGRWTYRLNEARGKHLKYMSYAFTESGIAMLSGVLRSPTAVEVNIRIMRAFVAMRHALASLAPLLARVEANERRQILDQAKNDANQLHNEERFKLILDAMQDKSFPPQKIFFDGQFYDAFAQMKKNMQTP